MFLLSASQKILGQGVAVSQGFFLQRLVSSRNVSILTLPRLVIRIQKVLTPPCPLGVLVHPQAARASCGVRSVYNRNDPCSRVPQDLDYKSINNLHRVAQHVARSVLEAGLHTTTSSRHTLPMSSWLVWMRRVQPRKFVQSPYRMNNSQATTLVRRTSFQLAAVSVMKEVR